MSSAVFGADSIGVESVGGGSNDGSGSESMVPIKEMLALGESVSQLQGWLWGKSSETDHGEAGNLPSAHAALTSNSAAMHDSGGTFQPSCTTSAYAQVSSASPVIHADIAVHLLVCGSTWAVMCSQVQMCAQANVRKVPVNPLNVRSSANKSSSKLQIVAKNGIAGAGGAAASPLSLSLLSPTVERVQSTFSPMAMTGSNGAAGPVATNGVTAQDVGKLQEALLARESQLETQAGQMADLDTALRSLQVLFERSMALHVVSYLLLLSHSCCCGVARDQSVGGVFRRYGAVECFGRSNPQGRKVSVSK